MLPPISVWFCASSTGSLYESVFSVVCGVVVFVDSAAVMYLLGTEMDYKKDELSSSFVFNNPNETERCGCGESFKI